MKTRSDSFKTIIVSLGRSTERIVMLFSTILLSRYLSQYDYGTYRQVLLVAGLLVSFLNLGIPNGINYFLPQLSKNEQKSFIWQTIIFQFLIGIVGALILYYSAYPIANRFDNPSLSNALRIYSIYPILFIPSMCYSNIFICIDKAKIAGLYSPLFGTIKVIFLIIAIFLKSSLISILQIVLLATAVQQLIVFISLYVIYKGIKLEFNYIQLYDQIKFSLPMGISTVIGLLIVKVDQFMISSMFNVEEYAVYSVGAIEIPFINMITVAGMAVITPYLVRSFKNNEMENFLAKWRNSLLKLSYIIFPAALFFVFFGREIITLIYGERYSESVTIFQIYQFKLLVKITFFGHVLLALGKSKIIMLYSFVTLILNILMNFLFINLFGYLGAALATVVSAFIISYLQLQKISNTINISFFSIWPWSKIIIILIISLVTGFISIVLRGFIESKILILIFGFVLYIIIYFIVTQFLLKKSLPKNLHYRSLINSIFGHDES